MLLLLAVYFLFSSSFFRHSRCRKWLNLLLNIHFCHSYIYLLCHFSIQNNKNDGKCNNKIIIYWKVIKSLAGKTKAMTIINIYVYKSEYKLDFFCLFYLFAQFIYFAILIYLLFDLFVVLAYWENVRDSIGLAILSKNTLSRYNGS